MAEQWLDLARYADTYGYQADVARDMSPYRDWVIAAFNRNLPYDQFLTWQLAGDLLPNATREQRVATAFNRLHRQTNEGGSIEEEFRTEYVADRVNTFGTAMLGLTLECARCHDHKFDAITQRDYFSLFAFFNSIDESGLYSHFTNATPSPSLLLWPSHLETAHGAVQAREAAAEAELARLGAAAETAFRAWRKTATLAVPEPVAHLPFDVVLDGRTPDLARKEAATLHDSPELVADAGASGGKALRFSGDNDVVLAQLRAFSRAEAFSVAVRLKPTERQPRAVVLHQSRAWTDAGSRGFELTLDEGRPFVGLIHFWPGNAIAIRAREPLPIGQWSSVVFTYDGSSRADGHRSLRRRRGRGGRRGARRTVQGHPLRQGRRRLAGRAGAADDRRALSRQRLQERARGRPSCLRRGAHGGRDRRIPAARTGRRRRSPGPTSWPACTRRPWPPRASLQALRVQENALIRRVPELMVMEELPEPSRPTCWRVAHTMPPERWCRATHRRVCRRFHRTRPATGSDWRDGSRVPTTRWRRELR